jgi:hypothetical protein
LGLVLLLLLLLALVHADAKIPRLYEEVPHSTGLVHINLHEVARLASAQLAATSSILPHKRLLDDQVGFREDAELRAKGLLYRCEEMKRRAVREIERGRC